MNHAENFGDQILTQRGGVENDKEARFSGDFKSSRGSRGKQGPDQPGDPLFLQNRPGAAN